MSKAAEPPVVPGRLYGLRRWQVSWDETPPRLRGWGRDLAWRPSGQPTKARCDQHRNPLHRAPAAECSCGLYGLHPRVSVARDLRRECAQETSAALVVGIVEAWGRVELHRDGFRAEYARPYAFVEFESVDDPAHAARTKEVARAHGVPVLRVAGAGSLYRHCSDQGLGMSDETVRELLIPVRGSAPVKPRPSRRRGSILEGAAELIGGLGFMVLWLVFATFFVAAAGGIAYAMIAAVVGDDAPAPAIGPNRHLRVIEQAVLALDGGDVLYVALVRNAHPRRTALGVFPRGGFLDGDGDEVGGPDSRFDVEQRPTLAPGQTGVVIDIVEDASLDANEVAGFDMSFRARGFRVGPRRAPVSARSVRFDRRRCLVTAELVSEGALAAVEVPTISRDRRGRIDAATVLEAGPVPRGRSMQVLERVAPALCEEGLPRLESYPDPRPGQL